jgi:hypothetical protein
MRMKHVTNRSLQAIESLWRIALILVVIVQLFIVALRTTLGRQTVPAAMIRMNLIRPRAAVALLSLVHPSEIAAVDALARQIETLDPHRPLVVDVTSHAHDRAVATLAYRIYPRTFTERMAAQGARNNQECIIALPSRTEVVLSCSGQFWRYNDSQRAFR